MLCPGADPGSMGRAWAEPSSKASTCAGPKSYTSRQTINARASLQQEAIPGNLSHVITNPDHPTTLPNIERAARIARPDNHKRGTNEMTHNTETANVTASPAKRGRPRIHASPTERAAAARGKRNAEGGSNIYVVLSREATEALSAIASPRERSSTIARLLIDEARKLQKLQDPQDQKATQAAGPARPDPKS